MFDHGAGRVLRISWDEGWGTKSREVKRGTARRGPEVVGRIGVDEKAIAKRPRYLTIVADLEQSRMLYLADDRKQESTLAYRSYRHLFAGRR